MMLYRNSQTPIHLMNYNDNKNIFYIKRDDLLPFSFGGNKVRISQKYFEDMQKKGYDCIIAYGNNRSNLCRVIANLSKAKGLPCYVISSADDSEECYETNNSIIVKMMGANVINCLKSNVSETVLRVIEECKFKGLKPYYIYGDIYGKGNEKVAVQAYVDAYNEIKQFQSSNNISFDYIFHASGTGITQSGLICGSFLHKGHSKIVGISVARSAETGKEIIKNNVLQYIGNKSIDINKLILFEDKYISGGYGKYNYEIDSTIKDVLMNDGIPLDPVYTGKAFWGMKQYLEEKSIENKKILFVHTGGLPLFFDQLNMNWEEG